MEKKEAFLLNNDLHVMIHISSIEWHDTFPSLYYYCCNFSPIVLNLFCDIRSSFKLNIVNSMGPIPIRVVYKYTKGRSDEFVERTKFRSSTGHISATFSIEMFVKPKLTDFLCNFLSNIDTWVVGRAHSHAINFVKNMFSNQLM